MFVFPYEMSPVHKQLLQSYANKFILPDIPSMDKAEHNLLLRSHEFQDIPFLLAVSSDGTIIHDYDSYSKALNHLTSSHMEKTACNIEAFARGVIRAVDSIRKIYHPDAFIKLNAKGAGGWSNVAPHLHTFLYNSTNSENERVDYLTKYINKHIVDEMLPSMAVVEEFIEPEKRPGNVDADYAVAGFVLNGQFFPTSINILGAENGRYTEMVGFSFIFALLIILIIILYSGLHQNLMIFSIHRTIGNEYLNRASKWLQSKHRYCPI